METLKIALFDLNKSIGGGQIALANLARALSKRGHEVHVILATRNLSSRLAATFLPYCHMHHALGYSNVFDIARVMGTAKDDILNLHRTHKFDILNPQGVNGLFVSPELRDRVVITLHGNNLCRGFTLLKNTYKNSHMRRACRYNVKNLIRVFSGSLIYGILEKIVCDSARLVITLTMNEAHLAKEYYHLSEEKIRVVPNHVFLPKNSLCHQLLIPQDKKVILSVNALSMVKGIPLLVETAERILSGNKDAIYVSVGDGPLIDIVRKLESKFPRKVIVLTHASNEIVSIYARSTLLLHGSLYEAFSLSIAESMLAGKPVVAFGTASIPELVIDNVTGCLAKPFCPKDLAEKTLDLLEDEGKLRRLGSTAKRRIEQLFSSEAVASKIEHVYKEALNR